MPIKLITGTPGAGKSLLAVELIEAERARPEPRPIYVHGLDGYEQPGVQELADPLTWQDLPDGSLIVVDEAQKVFPKRSQSAPAPIPPIAALSEHRHRGFDFVLVTQSPQFIDTYVRKLCSEHRHVQRKFGSSRSVITTWGEAVTDTQGSASLGRGVSKIWKHPAHLFALYQSATAHTIKPRVPWRLYAIPLLLVVIGGALWYFMRPESMAHAANVEPSKAAPAASTARANPSKALANQRYANAEEYAAYFRPRIDGMPWTAPAYDEREPESVPEVYCISSETKCRCITEQGTRVQMEPGMCKTIASQGVYNPFRQRRAEVASIAPAIRDSSPPPAERTSARTKRGAGGSNADAREQRPAFFSYESQAYEPMTQYGQEVYRNR